LTTEECVTMLLMEDNLSIYLLHIQDWLMSTISCIGNVSNCSFGSKVDEVCNSKYSPYTVEQLMKQFQLYHASWRWQQDRK
jgi:hypothetical protein